MSFGSQGDPANLLFTLMGYYGLAVSSTLCYTSYCRDHIAFNASASTSLTCSSSPYYHEDYNSNLELMIVGYNCTDKICFVDGTCINSAFIAQYS